MSTRFSFTMSLPELSYCMTYQSSSSRSFCHLSELYLFQLYKNILQLPYVFFISFHRLLGHNFLNIEFFFLPFSFITRYRIIFLQVVLPFKRESWFRIINSDLYGNYVHSHSMIIYLFHVIMDLKTRLHL